MEKGERLNDFWIVYLQYRCNGLFYCMKSFIPVLVSLLISSFFLQAQMLNKDSLLLRLPVAKEDTGKVMLLLKIADSYEANNQDSCSYYLEKSKQLSEILNFRIGIYYYFEQSAIVSFTKGDYNLAMSQSNSALGVARELKDSGLIINMLNNTGIVYQYLGQFDKQLEYTLQALEIAERNNRKEKLSGMYHNVANAYYNLEQWTKCIDYCRQSLSYYQRNGGALYLNRVYSTFGQAFYSLKKTDSAVLYFKKAIAESEKSGDRYAEASIYGYMVNAYAELNSYPEMLKAAEKSLAISRELQSDQMLASSLHSSAFAKYLNDNNAGAKKDIYEGLAIAKKNSFQDELKNIYIILSYIAAKEGDKRTFLDAMYKADSVKTSQLNETVVQSTTELEKKYEAEKKDNQIKLQKAELRRKNTFNYFLIGCAATILIISMLGYRNYRQKQKLQLQRINELETEKQLTATEAVLKGEEQERTRLAKDLHDGLGGMLSGIKYSFQSMKGNLVMTPDNHQAFERSMDMLDSSIKEMRRVAHNMMPEALVKFGLDTALKDFCNDINQSGALPVTYQSIGLENVTMDQTTAIAIYRIVQELINNTMKHAAAKTAIVQVTKTDGGISITVEDDGKGFDPVILKTGRGIGWSNIQSRIEYLKGKSDVQSEPGKGTSVLIELTNV